MRFKVFMYYQYHWRTSANSEVIKYVYSLPSMQRNNPGSFFDEFKWQYALEGVYSSYF